MKVGMRRGGRMSLVEQSGLLALIRLPLHCGKSSQPQLLGDATRLKAIVSVDE